MAFALNLVWLVASVAALLWAGARGRAQRAAGMPNPARALLATAVLSFVLLPTLSMSDDLLDAQQNALPASAQTWHLASAGASTGMDEPLILTAGVLLLMAAAACGVEAPASPERTVSRTAVWLMRSQRLRPPPVHVL